MRDHELDVLIACGAPPTEAAARVSDALLAPLDWYRLVNMADSQGMLPLLSRVLSQIRCIPAPPEALADIRARSASKAMRTLHMVGELARTLRLLDAAEIPAIAFKGPTLAHLVYGNFALRDSSDLDIYVPRNRITIARDLLVKDGYGKKSPGSNIWLTGACEVALRKRNCDYEIDLHWEFSPPYFNPFDASRAVSRSVLLQVASLAARTLCLEDLLLYLCIHGAREWWSIRLICDVAMLLHNCLLDWDDIIRESRRLQCWRILAIGLKLAIDLFQASVPPDVCRRVESDQPACRIASYIASNFYCETNSNYIGTSKGALLHLRMIEGPYLKARYVWRRTVQPNHLDADFLPLPQKWKSAYYVVRPVRVAQLGFWRLWAK
jgi:Uncharacterised nucleotidyltransferase